MTFCILYSIFMTLTQIFRDFLSRASANTRKANHCRSGIVSRQRSKPKQQVESFPKQINWMGKKRLSISLVGNIRGGKERVAE